jgi:hypothetical protein
MRRDVHILIVGGVLAVGLGMMVVFLAGLPHPLRLLFPRTFKPPEPNLAECTRVEVQYRPSVQGRFFSAAVTRSLLSDP